MAGWIIAVVNRRRSDPEMTKTVLAWAQSRGHAGIDPSLFDITASEAQDLSGKHIPDAYI